MSYKRIGLVAALAMLAACGSDSGTNPIDANISGSVSFNYTGGGNGSFSATGAITSAALASSPYTTTWAAGFKDSTDNSTNIAANIPKGSNTSDFAVITTNGQTASTYNVNVNCNGSNTTACNSVTLLTGQSANATTFTYLCSLTNGTITISSISNTKATGTFSGTGTCLTSTGASSAWVVTNGSFNVPLLSNVPSNLP